MLYSSLYSFNCALCLTGDYSKYKRGNTSFNQLNPLVMHYDSCHRTNLMHVIVTSLSFTPFLLKLLPLFNQLKSGQ